MKARRALRRAAVAVALAVVSGGLPVEAADPAKVLRVAISRGENGFDPALASEIYSSTVIAAIMRLKRPATLAMPPGRKITSAMIVAPSRSCQCVVYAE